MPGRSHRPWIWRGLVALVAVTVPTARAEEAAIWSPTLTGVLTLEDALAAALARNPMLAAVSDEIEARAAELRQADVRPNPEIGIDVENFAGSGALSGLRGTETTLLFSQTVEFGGKRARRRAVAEHEVELATWDRAAARAELLARTRTSFHGVIAAQERLAIADDLVSVAEQVLSAVSGRVRAGASSPVEESRARVELETTRIDRDRTASELQLARVRLAETWGAHEATFPTVQGSLEDLAEPVPLAAWEAHLDRAPGRARGRAAAAYRRALMASAEAVRTPDLTIGTGLRYARDTDDVGFVLELSAPLPIFDGNRGAVAAAGARVAQAEAEEQAIASGIRALVRTAHASLEEAWAEVRRLQEDALPEAERAFDTSREAYLRGAMRLTDVLDSERLLFQLRHRRIEALVRCHQAIAELETAVGVSSRELEIR